MTYLMSKIIDERVSNWESTQATYWVTYFHSEGGSHGVETHELVDCTFQSVQAWAKREANSRQYTVSIIVHDENHGLGKILLEGSDPNLYPS